MTFLIPFFIKLAATTSALSIAIRSLQPFLARELLLKYSIRLNKYELRTDIPTSCPSFYEVADCDSDALLDLDYDKYSGVWYNFATNDPTQPSGFCRCDRFNWSYNGREEGEGSYTSELDIMCKGLGIFRMTLEGRTNVTGIPGIITEGSPSFGADLIPGYVIWIDEDYSSTIRYFCTEDYLGVPVFSSLQIWTREPVKRRSERGQFLLEKAHELVPFADAYLDFADHSDCDKLPAIS